MGVCCSCNSHQTNLVPGGLKGKSIIGKSAQWKSKQQLDITKNYKFIRVCGYGQFGTVREAQRIHAPPSPTLRSKQSTTLLDPNEVKRYAVKSILKSRVKGNFETLKSEITALKTADHPNIVKLHQIYEDDKYLHMVMDLCTGDDLLETILTKGIMSEIQLAVIMEKILSAISQLHSLNICHRDIKPENMMFANDDPGAEIKLVDFGMAAKFSGNSMMSAVGTPYYIAPEVIQSKYGKECDIWSLGITIYFCLSGTHPFTAKTLDVLLRKIQSGIFSFSCSDPNRFNWDKVSFEAKDLIGKMLITKPNRRITIQRALQHPWFTKMANLRRAPIPSSLVRNMARPRFSGKLQKEVLKVLVRNLNEMDIANLKELFYYFDVEKTGMVTPLDIINVLRSSNGLQIASEEMKRIIRNFESIQEEKLKYTDFLSLVLDTKQLVEEENLWVAFRQFDTDDDNKISIADFQGALEQAGCQIAESEVEEIMREFQLHAQEFMDFEQFKEIMLCFTEGPSANSSGTSNLTCRFSRRRLSRLSSLKSSRNVSSLRNSMNHSSGKFESFYKGSSDHFTPTHQSSNEVGSRRFSKRSSATARSDSIQLASRRVSADIEIQRPEIIQQINSESSSPNPSAQTRTPHRRNTGTSPHDRRESIAKLNTALGQFSEIIREFTAKELRDYSDEDEKKASLE